MSRIFVLSLLMGVILALPLSLRGQEEPAEPVGEADAAAASESVDALADGEGSDEAEADAAAYADDLNDFLPSSEVPPDEQVTFPVDI